MTEDIGHADGLQVEHPGATAGTPGDIDGDEDLVFVIEFAKPVDLTDASLSISIYDEDGAFLSTPAARAATAITAGTPADPGEFSATQPQLATVSVALSILEIGQLQSLIWMRMRVKW